MAWTKIQDPVADSERGTLITFSEEAVDDSDKSLAISDELGGDTRLEVLGIRIEMTATATVGTRKMMVEAQDSAGDVIMRVQLSTNSDVTAGATKNIEAAEGLPSAAVGGHITEPLPPNLWLHSGQTLRVYDSAAIDAAADDMVVHVRGRRG